MNQFVDRANVRRTATTLPYLLYATRVHQLFLMRTMQPVQTSEKVKRFRAELWIPSIVCPFCRDIVHMCSTILPCVASNWVTAESRAGRCST